jgi:hypothetical protein
MENLLFQAAKIQQLLQYEYSESALQKAREFSEQVSSYEKQLEDYHSDNLAELEELEQLEGILQKLKIQNLELNKIYDKVPKSACEEEVATEPVQVSTPKTNDIVAMITEQEFKNIPHYLGLF